MYVTKVLLILSLLKSYLSFIIYLPMGQQLLCINQHLKVVCIGNPRMLLSVGMGMVISPGDGSPCPVVIFLLGELPLVWLVWISGPSKLAQSDFFPL